MTINTTRLAAAIAGLWALFALPMTQAMPDAHQPVYFVFWYAILLFPVWVIYGWRWISEKAPVPFKVWGSASLLASVIFAVFDKDVLLMAPLTTAVMMGLVTILDGWKSCLATPLAICKKPPVWLITGLVFLGFLLVQELSGWRFPDANCAFLVGVMLAWMMPYVIRRWNLSPAVAWGGLCILIFLWAYVYL